jgi:hypothetical protein
MASSTHAHLHHSDPDPQSRSDHLPILPFAFNLIDKKHIFPAFITQERVDQARQFVSLPTDIFIVTYPKCGTTWTQRLLHLIRDHGDVTKDPRTLADIIPWFEAVRAPSFVVSFVVALPTSMLAAHTASPALSLSLSLSLSVRAYPHQFKHI